MRLVLGLCFLMSLVTSSALAEDNRTLGSSDLALCAIAQTGRLDLEPVFLSQASLANSRARYLPNVSARLDNGRTRSTGVTSSGEVVRVALDQKILSAALLAELDAGNAAVQASRFDATQRALTLAVSALEDIVNLEKIQQQSQLLKVRLDSYQRLADILSDSQRLGLADATDYLQAKSYALNNKVELGLSDFAYKRAAAEFALKYGFPFRTLAEFGSPASSTVESQDLPEIKAFNFGIKNAEAIKKQADRSFWPELSLQASFSTLRTNGENTAASPTSDGTLSLVLDLSGLWTTRPQSTAYNAVREQREALRNQRQALLENQYRQLDEELRTIEELLPLLKERVETANKTKEV
ncbi:MAG: hypothetical protein EOP06_17980, partial [Proteobacteria bacterium]